MKSKGGKIEWCCNECKSIDIVKCVFFTTVSFCCNDCLIVRPWATRLKIPIRLLTPHHPQQLRVNE